MEYQIGSVAALISGNVTPNRPKLVKRALTPIKHPQSPNVTPRSEFVEDKSIFLSPSLQKKKAIIKKSPKRIFQNPDLEVTNDGENNTSMKSPNTDKVKKHLKDQLEDDATKNLLSPKSEDERIVSPRKLNLSDNDGVNSKENTPSKKKKKQKSLNESLKVEKQESVEVSPKPEVKSPKKKNKRKSQESNTAAEEKAVESPNKEIEEKNSEDSENIEHDNKENAKEPQNKKKKNKRRKKSKQNQNQKNQKPEESSENTEQEKSPKKKNKDYVNPNAVTDKDTDSEHESDNEIESENEEVNKEVLDTGPADDSSDEEEPSPKKAKIEETAKVEKKEGEVENADDVKRTLFVGNVPFSPKCKKEIKKIFIKYGPIDTVRIRTVPVKDARVTPKLAVIKNELHPDRTTVNVYVKFANERSVAEALAENNRVLNDHHLRVSRSDSTGAAHDPRCSVFIGNMPFGLEDEALRAKFEKCGEIESVRIIRDRKTNAGKGFGYVNFKSKDGVELALALTEEDLTIKNRIMRVKRCTSAAQRDWQERKKNKQVKGQDGQERKPFGQERRPFGQERRPFGQERRPFGQKKFGQGQRFRQGQGNPRDGPEDGAHRRIMHKRKNEENIGDGPPNKRQKNINQPGKEKKPRKEFVGMTSEKKKKRKFDKGQKKKKALSEILTKH